MSKEFDRATIQQAFAVAITSAKEAIGLSLDNGAHIRRAVRALFRLGAEMAIEAGAGPADLMALAVESFQGVINDKHGSEPCGKCPACLANKAKAEKEIN